VCDKVSSLRLGVSPGECVANATYTHTPWHTHTHTHTHTRAIKYINLQLHVVLSLARSLSVCLFVCLSFCLSVCLFVCLSVCLSVSLIYKKIVLTHLHNYQSQKLFSHTYTRGTKSKKHAFQKKISFKRRRVSRLKTSNLSKHELHCEHVESGLI
jgi:hypothetical protein